MAPRERPPDDITPAEFFTRWVPVSVARDAERRAQLAGTSARIVFHVEGEGGGDFTVVITGDTVTGNSGAVRDPDLRVRVDLPTWRRLNAGELAPPEAVLARRLRLEGDLRLGLKLHGILG